MSTDLSRRVSAARADLRALDPAAADRYLRDLRQTDPEAAAELGHFLDSRGREQTACGEPTVVGDPTTESWVAPEPAAGARPPADRTLGRFHLLRVVGRGAFGEVWQAYDPVLDKYVAVKAPLPADPQRTVRAATFLHEARKAASLRHPAIVQVYDVGETADGWFIVSEFVAGDSLKARMAAGRVPFDQTARVVATVAGALHAAHRAGLVHRDVKPANILLDATGGAYLTDFGLAVNEDEQRTERSKVAGTLAYMSPEQVRGDAHLLDGRSDIYALGAVLYELLTGRPLFRADDVAGYRELILRREPRPPRAVDDAVPEELERICLRCLAKEVRDRYRTAHDLARDLGAWLARADAPPAPAPRPRWPKALAAAALALALIGGAVGGAALIDGRSRTAAPVPTVTELLWPKGHPANKWAVLGATDELTVYTDATALLQLGETGADAWTLTGTFRQLNRVGGIGLFLGHRTDADTPLAAFEAITVVVVGDETFVQRSVETYPVGEPFVALSGRVCASVRVPDLLASNTVRLVVRDGRLADVWFNGVALPKLTAGTDRPHAAGPFGVLNRNSEGVFSNLTFDGNPIPLLHDPETPR